MPVPLNKQSAPEQLNVIHLVPPGFSFFVSRFLLQWKVFWYITWYSRIFHLTVWGKEYTIYSFLSQSLKEMEICVIKMRILELKTDTLCLVAGHKFLGTNSSVPFPPFSNLRTEPRMIISLSSSARGASRASGTWGQVFLPFQVSHLLQSLMPPPLILSLAWNSWHFAEIRLSSKPLLSESWFPGKNY